MLNPAEAMRPTAARNPSIDSSAAKCIACFLADSFKARNPKARIGTPTKAGIKAVVLLAPVAILTASDNTDDIREVYRLGANSYVPKPTGFAELTGAVRRIVEYWLTTNHGPPAEQGDLQYPGVQSV